MSVRYYIVGGYVRDKIMGRKSKDIDFAVEAASFDEMVQSVEARGGIIYLERPKFLAIRARMFWEAEEREVDADFVMCRQDGFYSDGRRPDTVEPGSIYDDLARRDFTMNAMAITEEGDLIDPHRGEADIESKELHCVGKAEDRFHEDALRLIRALRFSVTHGLFMSWDIRKCMNSMELIDKLVKNVSPERIREELMKALKRSTTQTLDHLSQMHLLRYAIFAQTQLWLKPTMEDKGA